MYIREYKKMSLHIRPIPITVDAHHPPPPDSVLMHHEFSLALIAPKGSGKTTTLCNLLLFYKNYFHSIVIFSPTVANDEKWHYIKQQPLLARNTALENFLKHLDQKKDSPSAVVGPAPCELNPLAQEPVFNPKIPEELFLTEYDESVLGGLLAEQQKMINFLEQRGKTKHLANRILLVFDDLVGSTLFSSRRNNVFKKLNTNHRHFSTSILLVSQAYKEIPKTVRVNVSGVILFEIANEKELECIYEENPCSMKKEIWLQVYHHAVAEPYGFMFIK